MAGGVFGPAFRGEVLDAEPELFEPAADETRALFVMLAGRIHRRNANHLGGEVHYFISGPFDLDEDPIDERGG